MNILSYIKLIKRKVDKFNRVVDNPIYAQKTGNPFTYSFDKTYVWVDKEEGNPP